MRLPFFIMFFCVFVLNTNAKNLYFSNSGSDSNSGTAPSSPWKSLSKLNSYTSLLLIDSVLFNRGDSFYGEININQTNLGIKRIVFSSYGTGAKPIITGFTPITSWTNLGGNIWESTNAVTSNMPCTVVTIGGQPVQMGRYPNTGWTTVTSSTATSITNANLASTNWTGAEVVTRKQRWITDKNKIISQSGSTINFANDGYYPQNGWGYFIQNDSRTLDVQNEWYYNPKTHKLRIYSSNLPQNVQISTVDTLVDLVYLANLTFDNLDFEGGNIYNFFIQSSKYITIQNCNINLSGCAGIFGTWAGYNSDNLTVKNNIFINNAANGIYLISTQFDNAYFGYNTFKKTGLAIAAGNTPDHDAFALNFTGPNTIAEYNVIDSTGYIGLCFNGNNTIVRNNYITNFCLLKDDGGGIYTGIGYHNPVATGQKVYSNIIVNGPGNSTGLPAASSGFGLANGIYLDDYTANVNIYNNTMANCSNSGIFLHNASNNNIHHNTAYNNITGQLVFQADSNTISGNIIDSNILVAATTAQNTSYLTGVTSYINHFGTFNYNYYERPMSDAGTILINNWSVKSTMSLTQWKSAYNQDFNSNSSPLTITDASQMRLEYNPSSSNRVVNLDAVYISATGKTYTGSLTLQPFTSIVLIKDSAICPPIPKPVITFTQ
jgi:parallel beta-helix repeat protein